MPVTLTQHCPETLGTERPASSMRPASSRTDGTNRWLRVAIACVILGASGAVRWWQDQRVQAVLQTGKRSPFPLKDLPTTLGTWRGEPVTPDEQIVRATGCSDSVFRHYVDQATGAGLEAYILYGPPPAMVGHQPEICYPTAGYKQVGHTITRPVAIGPIQAPFLSFAYAKGEGGETDLQEVYYAWRLNGPWTTSGGTMKQFERIPGLFKVQIARRLTDHERRDVGNPCEAFLHVLLPELEQRLSGTGKSG